MTSTNTKFNKFTQNYECDCVLIQQEYNMFSCKWLSPLFFWSYSYRGHCQQVFKLLASFSNLHPFLISQLRKCLNFNSKLTQLNAHETHEKAMELETQFFLSFISTCFYIVNPDDI